MSSLCSRSPNGSRAGQRLMFNRSYLGKGTQSFAKEGWLHKREGNGGIHRKMQIRERVLPERKKKRK